jgi:hypothetical protein
MKKWLLAAGVILILGLAAIYLLVPSRLNVVVVLPAKCNVEAADRMLRDTGNRAKWWPDEGSGGMRYKVTGLFRRMVEVTIDDGGLIIPTRLSVFPKVSIDSSELQWELNLPSGLNPVRRIGRYREVKRIEANMGAFLGQLRANLEDQEKVYGISIRETSTTDSVLISRRQIFGQYPADSAVYVLVGKLKQFVMGHGGRETGYPMLNVTRRPGGDFEVRVALPTDKVMRSDGIVECRELIHGKYLEADVHGGDGRVRDAMDQMRNYISDYQRTVMAIPFQSLVTDRMKETDTTKWLTKLYFPIF